MLASVLYRRRVKRSSRISPAKSGRSARANSLTASSFIEAKYYHGHEEGRTMTRWFAVAPILVPCALAIAAERPVYEVARVRTPIKVDGRLDEAAWGAAAAIDRFVNNADASASPYVTEARIL